MRRVNPFEIGVDQDNYHFHLARYMFVARQLNPEDSVLEVGCGVGYGSRLLADFCRQVTATDAEHALQSHWDRFSAGKSNLTYVPEVPDGRFDAVVSLEVIEHIEERHAGEFLEMLKAHTTDRGTVFLSTPRALPFEQRSRNRQLEHPKEYSPAEFKTLLRRHFSRVLLFGQNDAIISVQNPDAAWNLVAICIP